MPLTTPSPEIMNQKPMHLMDMFGKLYSYADKHEYKFTQPAIWQCSDESQGIKKSLFGYVFDCPVFNLGQVGALVDPHRMQPASHHGEDMIIVGGSHVGAKIDDGIGYIDRVNGSMSPCCGMLFRILSDYLDQYKRAQMLIKITKKDDKFCIILPYKYLHKQQAIKHAELMVRFDSLISGEAIEESSHGKVFPLTEKFVAEHMKGLMTLTEEISPIDKLLTKDTFKFITTYTEHPNDFGSMLNASLLEFMPEIVSSDAPHRRIADINTWREFHKITSYLTDNFLGKDRNIFLLAGLTIDHSTRKNTFIPQFGFAIDRNDTDDVNYYNPVEVNELLGTLDVYKPSKTYLEFAGIE